MNRRVKRFANPLTSSFAKGPRTIPKECLQAAIGSWMKKEPSFDSISPSCHALPKNKFLLGEVALFSLQGSLDLLLVWMSFCLSRSLARSLCLSLSLTLSLFFSLSLSLALLGVYLNLCLPIGLSISISISVSLCLDPSTFLSFLPSVYLYICLSTYL